MKLEELRTKVMGQACSCDSINRRAAKIREGLYALACCPKCCWCHWEKAEDELKFLIRDDEGNE